MFNQNTGYLDTSKVWGAEVDTGGRFFTGLGIGFYEYRFPKMATTLKLTNDWDADTGSIVARDSIGLRIEVACSFQYRLMRDAQNLTALFDKYGTRWEYFYLKYTRTVVRSVIGNYNVTDMWGRREVIGEALHDAMDKEMRTHHAAIEGFQLLSLTIPTLVQGAIEATTVKQQEIEKARTERTGAVVTAQTQRLLAETNSDVLVIDATSYAFGNLTAARAAAVAANFTVVAETSALQAVKDELELNTTQLLHFQFLDGIRQSYLDTLIINAKQPPSLTLK